MSGASLPPADPGIADAACFDAARPLARELELSLDERAPFTVAAVGDCILSRPLAAHAARDPRFAALLALLRGADFYDRWVLLAVLAVGAIGSALLDYRAVRDGRLPYVQP
jgi:hypothetical protein